MSKFRINWDLIKNIIFGIFTLGVWFLLKTKPGQRKSALREWVDAIIFAVIAATIIRTFFIEAYTIPTPSMARRTSPTDSAPFTSTGSGKNRPGCRQHGGAAWA